MPGYVVGQQHIRICEALEAVERGEIRRLMIFMPPRHGKSQLVSKHFPAWYFGRNPTQQIISASYGQDLSNDFGRDVRNIIASQDFKTVFKEVGIAQDSSAKNRWHTADGGSYVAAGVGTAITGRGANILNIDDPVRDRAAADSELVRESVWGWYTSTAYTRLMPGGAVILTMTRWHEDDLAGRLLAAQAEGGDQWHVINMPAIDVFGNPLWPEKYDTDALNGIRNAIGERDWSALYQQDPRPADGAIFKVDELSTITVADIPSPAGVKVRAWDLAATADSGTRNPDWTVGVLMERCKDNTFIVHDVKRFRGGPEEVEKKIVSTAVNDGKGVLISLPQDPGQAGKAQIQYLTKKLLGFRVASSPETGDKATRAAPYAAQVNVGNIKLLKGTWNRDYQEELRSFPSGTKDDQVDASSRAFNMLTGYVRPAIKQALRI